MSIFNQLKKTNIIKKDENWVAKILKKRMMTPIYISIVIVVIIILDSLFNAYLDSSKIVSKNEKVQNRINNTIIRTKNVKIDIEKLKEEILFIKGTSLDTKGAITLMTRVCQMLKNKDIIGSFYIKKKNNNKYSNVSDFEIQVSYGDKDLLFLVSKLVLDKVFYLKDIKRTNKGLTFKLYKPAIEVNNEK